MAHLVSDSFDWYATTGDMAGVAGPWDAVNATNQFTVTTGRFTGSQGVTQQGVANATQASRAWGSNESTVVIRFAHKWVPAFSGTNIGAGFTLYDGTSAQCSVCFRSDGAILLISGAANSGTTLATYTSAFTSGTWIPFEMEIVINNTTGSWKVLKNGNVNTGSPDFSATSLNTRAGSTNNYCNKIAHVTGPNQATIGNAGQVFDDFLMFSESGAAPNTFGIGDVRAVQQMPNSNNSTQWSPAPTPVAVAPYTTATQTSTNAANAAMFLNGGSTPAGINFGTTGTISSIVFWVTANATANVKVAIYDNTGAAGSPGAPLGTSNVVVNPTLGPNTATFSSPVQVTAGSLYYVAFDQDASVTYVCNGTGSSQSHATITYASFPTTNPTLVTSNFGPYITFNVVPNTNYAQVKEAQEDGDTTYVYDGTVGQVDRYTVPALATTPVSIVMVKPYAFCRKDDAGTRQMAIELVSHGGTVTDVAATNLASSYGYIQSVLVTDPDTGAAWSTSVTLPDLGPKVTA